MKICYFNGGMRVPSVRFRIPLFELLQRRQHQCTYLNSIPSRYDHFRWIGLRSSGWLRKMVRRWHIAKVDDGKFDAVVLETGIFHTDDYSFEKKLRAATGRLIYDVDDAVFLLFPEKTRAIAEMADRVIAGNQRIADWARQFNHCVSIIPTCVDAAAYTEKNYNANPQSSRPVVGWIGSPGNVQMLSVCASALRKVASQRDFELRVITSDERAINAIDLAGVNVRWVNINRCDTVAELHQFDVGITPLPDNDPWMEYKCDANMIQYMAVGVPAIGSAIGFNNELVQDGTDSMLAKDDDQWVSSLNELLDSADLRHRLGQSARKKILKSYTAQGRTREFEQAILGTKSNPGKRVWKYESALEK